MKRFKYAEQKIYCNCIEVYQIYEDDDYNKIFEVLSKLGNKNFKKKTIIISIEKLKQMLQNPDFEQNYYSRTATGIYKSGHDNIGRKFWLTF